ncbi:hypothetical protein ACFRMN_10845 [Streptomyces sp. NPDC056835]|uniref:hypothetical protein n=1 Tax=Streptomyces sp. NPDC056835 TaxID=3345956 RepID=UPI0036AE7DAD
MRSSATANGVLETVSTITPTAIKRYQTPTSSGTKIEEPIKDTSGPMLVLSLEAWAGLVDVARNSRV